MASFTTASTTFLSPSTTSRSYISPKSSSSSSSSFSQTLIVPSSFNSLHKLTPSTSFPSRSHSRNRFISPSSDLPLVGNVAPDIKANAVDQKFVKVKTTSNFPPLSSRPQNTDIYTSPSPKTTLIPPSPIPPKTPLKPPATNPNSEFQEKIIFLDSLNIDLISLLASHPPVSSVSIASIRSTVSFLYSVGLTPPDLNRIINMCPEIITVPVAAVVSSLTFLLRDVGVSGGRDLRRVLRRRPRLLASSVELRLRPTLYFLQGTVGITDLRKHTELLSCSVESKLLPRIHYFEKLGFSYRDAISMFRRFPCLFCYSIVQNLEPKFNYFVVEMGRELKELKEFPQYFSFSLENRIKPRHQYCVEKRVCLSLPIILRSSDARFRQRVDLYCSSTMPVRTSPLSYIKHDDNVL